MWLLCILLVMLMTELERAELCLAVSAVWNSLFPSSQGQLTVP